MPNPTTSTPTESWRPQEGFYLELPSGKTVKMRRSLDIFDMMKEGNIPNVLKGVVEEALKSGDPTKMSISAVDDDAISGMVEFVDNVVLKVVQEPRVVNNPDRLDDEEDSEYEARIDQTDPPEGAIWLKWIDVEDRMFIFSVAQGGTTDIAKFRDELFGNVGAVSDEWPVPKPTKRTGGPAKKRS